MELKPAVAGSVHMQRIMDAVDLAGESRHLATIIPNEVVHRG